MHSSTTGLLAIAAAIAFVGALWAGLPLVGLAPLLILLVCPVAMIVMMRGMHGDAAARHHGVHEHGDQHVPD